MANDLILGRQPAGNTLYLFPAGYALGAVTDEDVLVGIPPTFGVVFEVDIVEGIGRFAFYVSGAVTDSDVLSGIGQSNTGFGAIVDSDAAACDTLVAIAPVTDSDTLVGEGGLTFLFAPTKIWPGFTSDGTSITIPIAELGGQLTAAEASMTAGDWREVLMALLLSVNTFHKAMPASNRPRTFQSNELIDWNYQHRTLGRVIRREVFERINIEYATRRVASEV